MKLNTYQLKASRTMSTSLPFAQVLANYALGLGGEAGEVLEPIKKFLFHAKPLDDRALALELGDVLWYVAALASTLGFTLEDIAQANLDKLAVRRPPKGAAK